MVLPEQPGTSDPATPSPSDQDGPEEGPNVTGSDLETEGAVSSSHEVTGQQCDLSTSRSEGESAKANATAATPDSTEENDSGNVHRGGFRESQDGHTDANGNRCPQGGSQELSRRVCDTPDGNLTDPAPSSPNPDPTSTTDEEKPKKSKFFKRHKKNNGEDSGKRKGRKRGRKKGCALQ
ncbi:hypothetical protein AGOR_G00088180 [Albula goreensis]|uniref:Uncharacterized protein n=1 Tax=Albula goreensis TaxID=1534307 RepID=A0A8T3DL04_9TELE|nr:hypothetical protein AGOR_G00088180 [Albula goreensis]